MPSTTLRPEDVVRLRNVGAEQWVGKYANQDYRMNPGQEAIVSFAAACLWFGHPDAVDVDDRNRYRTEEHERLRVRYGVYDSPIEVWDANTPNIEVHDLDGNRLITVVDDPEGKHLNPAVSSQQEKTLMVEQMTRMQQQMKAMQAQMDQAERGDVAIANSGDVDEDESPFAGLTPSPTPVIGGDIPPPSDASEDIPTRVRVGSTRRTS